MIRLYRKIPKKPLKEWYFRDKIGLKRNKNSKEIRSHKKEEYIHGTHPEKNCCKESRC